jgi:hypothetical protein
MKKSIILNLMIMVFCLVTTTVFAQYKKPNRIFKKGQFDIHANIGLAPSFLADRGKSIVPPMIVGADYLIGNQFSLGLSFGHSVTQTRKKLISDGLFGRWRNRSYEMTIKTGIHITRFENISIHGGFAINYYVALIEGSHPDMEKIAYHKRIQPKEISIFPNGFLGLKYAISPKLTLIGELGFSGISIFKIGVGYRVK